MQFYVLFNSILAYQDDGTLFVLFNSISVILGCWEDDNGRLCAMESS